MSYVCGDCRPFSETKRPRLDSFHQQKQERPRYPYQQVHAQRSADGVARYGLRSQHRSEDGHRDKGKEEGASPYADDMQPMAVADRHRPYEGKGGKAEHAGNEGNPSIVAERRDTRNEGH